jgi:hypothetical protein
LFEGFIGTSSVIRKYGWNGTKRAFGIIPVCLLDEGASEDHILSRTALCQFSFFLATNKILWKHDMVLENCPLLVEGPGAQQRCRKRFDVVFDGLS